MKRWWALPLASVLLTWAAAELFVAPLLHRHLDWLGGAYGPLDVDHRMRSRDPELPTNSDGVRSPFEPAYYSGSGFNIVFLGDSFVFGQGLAYGETVPRQLERMLRTRNPSCDVKVVNFGWMSSSPLLSERLLRRIGAHYHPDLVILGLDMTDFHDDLKYRRILEHPGPYRALARVPIATSALRHLAPGLLARLLDLWTGSPLPRDRFFVVNQPPEESRPLAEALVRSLERLDETARGLGADFATFVFPRNFQYDPAESPGSWEAHEYSADSPYKLEPFRLLAEQDGRLGFRIHSLLGPFQETDVFPTCFPNDPHWNRQGAAVAAGAIADLLAERVAAEECSARHG